MAKKILLADDSVTIQKIVELTFEGEGFDLEVVSDGHDALKQAEASPPDIILADLTMPGLSGIELCRKIRAHSELKSIPIVLLTNSFEEFNRAEGDEAGVSAYVEKPFESQALIDQVQELLSEEAALTDESREAEELHPPADEVDFISEEPEEDLFDVASLEADALPDELAATAEPTEEDEEEEEVLILEDVVVEEELEETPAPSAAVELEEPTVVEEAEEVLEEEVEVDEPEVPAPALAFEVEEPIEAEVVDEEIEEEEEEPLEAEVMEEAPEPVAETAPDEVPEEPIEAEEAVEPERPSEAFISMMDSTMAALGLREEADMEQSYGPALEEDLAAQARAALEETVGDAVRSYIDLLINQAVEQLTPTITIKVAERLEATFPPLAERIIREEIEKLKRGE